MNHCMLAYYQWQHTLYGYTCCNNNRKERFKRVDVSTVPYLKNLVKLLLVLDDNDVCTAVMKNVMTRLGLVCGVFCMLCDDYMQIQTNIHMPVARAPTAIAARSEMNHSGELKPRMPTPWNFFTPTLRDYASQSFRR